MDRKRIIISVGLTFINVLATYLLHCDVVSNKIVQALCAIPYLMLYIPVIVFKALGVPALTKGDYYSLYLTNYGWILGTILMLLLHYFVTCRLIHLRAQAYTSVFRGDDL